MNKTTDSNCINRSQCMKLALAYYQEKTGVEIVLTQNVWRKLKRANMISAGHNPCNHVKTPVFMMQNYHLAQTTHNTKDTDKVHGRLYGRCFLKYSSAFQVTQSPFLIAFGYA